MEKRKPLGGASQSLRRPKLPLRTPSLATRFWRGDERARVARVALGVGLNKVNKKWESTQPMAAMVSHFWLEKSYVLNFFSFYLQFGAMWDSGGDEVCGVG